MDIPSAGMIRNSRPHLDQTFEQPVDRPPHIFPPDIELPDHVQEIVSQDPHLQAGLVRSKPLTTGLVPAQDIFALFDPVFDFSPAVIDLDHFTGRQP